MVAEYPHKSGGLNEDNENGSMLMKTPISDSSALVFASPTSWLMHHPARIFQHAPSPFVLMYHEKLVKYIMSTELHVLDLPLRIRGGNPDDVPAPNAETEVPPLNDGHFRR